MSKFVVLTKSLQPGGIIGMSDVRFVQRDANPGVGYFRNIDDVVGRRQKGHSRSIRSFAPAILSLIMPSIKISL